MLTLTEALIDAGRREKFDNAHLIVLAPSGKQDTADASVRQANHTLSAEDKGVAATVAGTDKLSDANIALVINVRRAFDGPVVAYLG